MLTVISCAQNPPRSAADATPSEFVRVAVINPAQQDHVVEILRRAGIRSFCEGSLAYAVMVQQGTEVRAKALLQKEAAGADWIWFP
jgi:hypothetical protein